MTDLRKKAQTLDPIIRIGKHGVTPHVLDDITMHLKKRKLIKVKMLPSFIKGKDKKTIAEDIAAQTGSQLVCRTGFVFALHKR